MTDLIKGMSAWALALIVLTGVTAVAGLALCAVDAAQSEARTWIRDGDGCRYVPVSEAVNALPCQS